MTAPEPPTGEPSNPLPRHPSPAPPAKFVGLAYAALILGIIGVVFSIVPFLDVLTMLAAIVGIVLGAVALAGSQKIVAGIGGRRVQNAGMLDVAQTLIKPLR